MTLTDLDVDVTPQMHSLLPEGETLPLREAMKRIERRLILQGLNVSGGNRKEAARLLDINRTTLYNKLHEHDIMDA